MASFFCIFAWYKYQFVHLKNFNTVVPGLIYRSAQPTEESFSEWQQQHKFKSIINLRGHEYCKDEPEALEFNKYSKEYNIDTKFIALDSKKLPYPNQVLEIINFIENSEKPLLIHCKHGVDRTGLISAIAVILHNQPVEQALLQISLKKGFLPFRHHEILRTFIYDYQNWLKQNNLNSSNQHFKNYIHNVYSVEYTPKKYRLKKITSYLSINDWKKWALA